MILGGLLSFTVPATDMSSPIASVVARSWLNSMSDGRVVQPKLPLELLFENLAAGNHHAVDYI